MTRLWRYLFPIYTPAHPYHSFEWAMDFFKDAKTDALETASAAIEVILGDRVRSQ